MSHELDDDALDAALAKLGLPAEAAPLSSAAAILARAAPVAPVAAPVAVGITGFKLAAMLAVAVGFGFGGGLITHFAGDVVVDRLNAARAEADAARQQDAASGVRPKQAHDPEPEPSDEPVAPQIPAAPASASREDAADPRPSSALPARPRAVARRPAATAVAPTVSPERDAPVSQVQPDVSPAPPQSDEVVQPEAVDPAAAAPTDALAVAPASVAPEPVEDAVEPRDELDDDVVADLDGLVTTLDPHRDAPAAPPRRDRLGIAAVAAVAFPPPEAEIPPNGILISASVSHRTSPDGRAPFVAGIADVGLLAGKEGRRITGAVTGVGGVSWEWGAARLDLGWSASVRGLTGMSGQPGGPRDVPSSPRRGGESFVLSTGPRAIVSLGEAGGARLHLDVAPQITGGGASVRPLPWLDVALGFDFGLKPRS